MKCLFDSLWSTFKGLTSISWIYNVALGICITWESLWLKIKESPLYSGLNKDFFHTTRNLKIHSCCPELPEIALAFVLWLQNGSWNTMHCVWIQGRKKNSSHVFLLLSKKSGIFIRNLIDFQLSLSDSATVYCKGDYDSESLAGKLRRGLRITPLSMGFPRQEYWSGLPFPSPGDLPGPGIKSASPSLADGFF